MTKVSAEMDSSLVSFAFNSFFICLTQIKFHIISYKEKLSSSVKIMNLKAENAYWIGSW